jgi:hypothetical protein
MPAGKRGGLHNGQGLAPIKPATEPDEGETGGVGRTSWLDVTFLIQRELFTEKEVFGGQGSGWTEAEPQEAHPITQECQEDTGELYKVTEQARRSRHRQGILLPYR